MYKDAWKINVVGSDPDTAVSVDSESSVKS